MASIQLSSTSMFQRTPVYQLPGQSPVFGLRIQSMPQNGDQLTVVTGATANRPDQVSNFFQGNPALWWLIADLTQMVDPLTEFSQSTQVRFSPTGTNR